MKFQFHQSRDGNRFVVDVWSKTHWTPVAVTIGVENESQIAFAAKIVELLNASDWGNDDGEA